MWAIGDAAGKKIFHKMHTGTAIIEENNKKENIQSVNIENKDVKFFIILVIDKGASLYFIKSIPSKYYKSNIIFYS